MNLVLPGEATRHNYCTGFCTEDRTVMIIEYVVEK